MGLMQTNLSKLVSQLNRSLALGALMPICALSLTLVFKAKGQQQQEQGNQQQPFRFSFVPPAVFQAAGPKPLDQTHISIQTTGDAFRAALGDPNNGNAPTLPTGRREINWDGGGNNFTTSPPVTPFDVFLNT